MMSEEKEKKDLNEDLNTKESKKELKKKKKDAIELLEENIATLTAEVDEWKNKFYGVYADMDNAKKQNNKDQAYFIKYRATGFIDKLLSPLDAFASVLRNEPDDPVLKNYLVGFNYIYKLLREALESEGVQEISPKPGDKFDAKVMHAIDTEYRTDLAPNLVTEVHNNAYLLHDRILRPASVIVSTNIAEKEDDTAEQSATTTTTTTEELN